MPPIPPTPRSVGAHSSRTTVLADSRLWLVSMWLVVSALAWPWLRSLIIGCDNQSKKKERKKGKVEHWRRHQKRHRGCGRPFRR
ncbi:uncharacterized protein IWZ02DRAFT_464367 [Phyllosticta citriasiana]|uniref:uncharacterized protein n=1 Tax=Phyllosticta citriasiana TaxID=595635 RepID=UPI0030FD95BD